MGVHHLGHRWIWRYSRPAVDYSEAYGGCDGGGAYSRVPVPPFWAGYLPIAAGNLKPGDWMLVGTEYDLSPSARSQSFHVSVCTDCVPDGPLRKSDTFKAVANTAITSLTAICNGLAVWSVLKRAKELYAVGMTAYGIGGLTVGVVTSVDCAPAGVVAWNGPAPSLDRWARRCGRSAVASPASVATRIRPRRSMASFIRGSTIRQIRISRCSSSHPSPTRACTPVSRSRSEYLPTACGS